MLSSDMPTLTIVTFVQQMCVVSYFIRAGCSAILPNRKRMQSPKCVVQVRA